MKLSIINLKVAAVIISMILCNEGRPLGLEVMPKSHTARSLAAALAKIRRAMGSLLFHCGTTGESGSIDNRTGHISMHTKEIGKHGDRNVADALAKDVRILCLVLTAPMYHETRAKHVKATWGKHCNVLLFMSTETDQTLPTVPLKVEEGYEYLWGKTKESFRYAHQHYRDKADWFIKTDDDTFVVVENLRYLLSNYNTNESIYFGYRYKPFRPQGYMSGGAGYVMSRAALDRLVIKGLGYPHVCKEDNSGAEDAELGICLADLGVKAMDSRDALGRSRFNPFPPKIQMFPNHAELQWFFTYSYYPPKEGPDCCSDHVITFHYIYPEDMYLLEYLIHHVNPYGISYDYLKDFTDPAR